MTPRPLLLQAQSHVSEATAELQRRAADAEAAAQAAQQQLGSQQREVAAAETAAVEARSRVATLHAQLAERYDDCSLCVLLSLPLERTVEKCLVE